ncbi:uncharacterized protein BO95DRAFT_226980 [Aspergillus brunneoviolaceus CBS 621.78]|uniref:Uncharacterized protein n=1 Tax=Aspergillus brunneoviolaceus CBS 621.78 TaxID=1450534 RepID=A0ACD1G0J5_9EURO|nr:hypothetical protein BO95DRAFT_226980 [Aspergillus brunneoviolaceus CBS 621.78]RAH42764.1 hypothetical protein BO95DRAFT_226980 [Aspergillus brunneoviolaceus CBS 621.78]
MVTLCHPTISLTGYAAARAQGDQHPSRGYPIPCATGDRIRSTEEHLVSNVTCTCGHDCWCCAAWLDLSSGGRQRIGLGYFCRRSRRSFPWVAFSQYICLLFDDAMHVSCLCL